MSISTNLLSLTSKRKMKRMRRMKVMERRRVKCWRRRMQRKRY
jgi:hypothetical protein